jgi:cytochrome oxidase assembly protein ShyY1
VYRFLLTPRWLAAAALAIAAALVMVRLGEWQLHRYEERHAINTRIDAADSTRAVPLTSVVTAPTVAGKAGPTPGSSVAWTKVTFSGQYDPSHEIQARARTVNGDVGFEILTPLLLSDGGGVLVDRGWVPAPEAGALAAPTVPPAPAGPVTVVGQVHLSESRPTPIEHRDGRLDTRRISVPRLAEQMPFPVYGAYILLTEQTPANSHAFSEIPIDHEDDWQNAGYTVQWWLFACMPLYAYVYYARKEAQLRAGVPPKKAASPPPTGDRVEEADRELAAARTTPDGQPEAGQAEADNAEAGRTETGQAETSRTEADRSEAASPANRAETAGPTNDAGAGPTSPVEAAGPTDSTAGAGPADRAQKAPSVDRVDAKGRADRKQADKAARKQAEKEAADRKRAAKIERIRAEAVRKAPVDRVEEADRKRAEAEAKRKLAAQSGQD